MNNNKQEQEDPLKVVLVKVALAAFQGSKDTDKQDQEQEEPIIHSVIYLRNSRSSLEEGVALGELEEEVQEQVNHNKEKAKT